MSNDLIQLNERPIAEDWIIKPAIIFDGYQFIEEKFSDLKAQVANLEREGKKIQIAAVAFLEDRGSQIYTQAKKDMAERLGIKYQPHWFSIKGDVSLVISTIKQLNQDPEITGIIIQKPWRNTWVEFNLDGDKDAKQAKEAFGQWWSKLIESLDPKKDVDGLHPDTLARLSKESNDKFILPATARAVLAVLDFAQEKITQKLIQQNLAHTYKWQTKKILIIGQSDLVGKPLFYYLKTKGVDVEMIGKKGFCNKIEQASKLKKYEVIISATGRSKLVTGQLVGNGCIVIDVGEPRPDIDFASVVKKANFITPVPGGIGPVTVFSLMENGLDLIAT